MKGIRTVSVYLPAAAAGKVVVDLSEADGRLAVTWIDALTGKTTTGSTTRGGARRTLKAPAADQSVLRIRRMAQQQDGL